MIGDHFASTLVLVSEDTVLESNDGVDGAGGLALSWDVRCDVVGSDFKGTGVVLIAAAGGLLC